MNYAQHKDGAQPIANAKTVMMKSAIKMVVYTMPITFQRQNQILPLQPRV